MKNHIKNQTLFISVVMLLLPAITYSQGGLLGSWKYSSPAGEMNMKIEAGTIVINNQTFPYKAEGNVLMINEGNTTTPYPFMLDGNQLTIEFPGGVEIVFTRQETGSPKQGQLPQSMARPSGGPGQQGTSLSGKWLYQSPQGQLVLEFLSKDQLTFNGETTRYQLKEGVIQAMGDYGWIDYPYTLNQGVLTVTFPDGTRVPFSKTSVAPANQPGGFQQGTGQQSAAGGAVWQLRGSLCSWSDSSGSGSSFYTTQKMVTDGQGHFQFGSESSFSGDAGIAYSGNPNIKRGTYSVGESIVTFVFEDGDTYQLKINMRQDNGMITELMLGEKLFAKALCE